MEDYSRENISNSHQRAVRKDYLLPLIQPENDQFQTEQAVRQCGAHTVHQIEEIVSFGTGNDISELKSLSDTQGDGPKHSTQKGIRKPRPNADRAQSEFNGRADSGDRETHFAFGRD
ncbi:hypothetical protein EAI_08309 [Harpegnathos saltator]|uniref:Uncharacterized protein n=1 Tax=Harpegnathos saltator TaxID=610380 RepID=E2BZM8_HARSA|nr:hypothetical protein EAI_08309 [Harpegnathos saltator]